jgi:hypothetical protein
MASYQERTAENIISSSAIQRQQLVAAQINTR